MALDRRLNVGQGLRLICDQCKQPMITFIEDEAHDPIRSYGKGYIGRPVLPDNYCHCPEAEDSLPLGKHSNG